MPEPCGRAFDEALLSGYLDDALIQGDDQRVRVHLEDCATCRTLVEELAALRETTMGSTFEEWAEAPRTRASGLIRGLGWPLVIAWATLVVGYALWEGWLESENLIERLMLVGGVSGFALLLLGVLVDRLKAMKTDRYLEVQK